MAAEADKAWLRRALAIGLLSFGALGVVGCDNTETGETEEVEQEATTEEGATEEADDQATGEDISPTQGEHPAEDDEER